MPGGAVDKTRPGKIQVQKSKQPVRNLVTAGPIDADTPRSAAGLHRSTGLIDEVLTKSELLLKIEIPNGRIDKQLWQRFPVHPQVCAIGRREDLKTLVGDDHACVIG